MHTVEDDFDLKVVSVSLSVISNTSVLLIQRNHRDMILPVWTTLCAVDSRGRVIQLNFILVPLLFHIDSK